MVEAAPEPMPDPEGCGGSFTFCLHIFSLFSIYIKIFPNDALSAFKEGKAFGHLEDRAGRAAWGWIGSRARGILRRVHQGVAEEVLGQDILILRIDDGAYGFMQF
ncbi:hypothetical protein TRIP_B350364 [uncultured Desulfatiglans sp.]|uniref:Uncharacterized protein n=1 Tax=Uncultured Desulfatiglans sp. TaxID=1748965 RepID=A0A653ACQ3_UNCDX|nr:hypothetical protein TRIP_B350364 [uncultured Desulfatiglans sp.]